MKTSDLPKTDILRFMASRTGSFTWLPELENSISSILPGVSPKLVLSKMRSLIKRGLVDGCSCGCRGTFTLTEKGRKMVQ